MPTCYCEERSDAPVIARSGRRGNPPPGNSAHSPAGGLPRRYTPRNDRDVGARVRTSTFAPPGIPIAISATTCHRKHRNDQGDRIWKRRRAWAGGGRSRSDRRARTRGRRGGYESGRFRGSSGFCWSACGAFVVTLGFGGIDMTRRASSRARRSISSLVSSSFMRRRPSLLVASATLSQRMWVLAPVPQGPEDRSSSRGGPQTQRGFP